MISRWVTSGIDWSGPWTMPCELAAVALFVAAAYGVPLRVMGVTDRSTS